MVPSVALITPPPTSKTSTLIMGMKLTSRLLMDENMAASSGGYTRVKWRFYHHQGMLLPRLLKTWNCRRISGFPASRMGASLRAFIAVRPPAHIAGGSRM
jgi:hypothetical protein